MIGYYPDKQNEGVFNLRGLEAELTEGAVVEITTKAGKVRKETVGRRIAGPFPDGNVIHAKAGAQQVNAPKQAAPSAFCPHCGSDVNKPPAKQGDIPF